MSDIPILQSARPYVSKRKRNAAQNAASTIPVPAKRSSHFSKDIFLTDEIVYQSSLHSRNHVPSRRRVTSVKVSDVGPIWKVEWCKKHSHLLACVAGKGVELYNCIGKLENVWSSSITESQIKDVVWSRTCKQLLSCNLAREICEMDFLSEGQVASSFSISEVPSVVQYWPDNDNIVLVGGENSFLASYDIRSCKRITTYDVEFGRILDLAVLPGTGNFITTTDAVSRESASHSIVVWDFASGAKISDQIFHEKFTCPKLCVHPSRSSYLAQTNGDYIARFSAYRPYKLDKYVRYGDHLVQGFPIGIDISYDGKIVVSGSSDGSVCFYKFKDASLIRKIPTGLVGSSQRSVEGSNAVVTVKYHPVLSSTVAAGDWSGNLHLFQ